MRIALVTHNVVRGDGQGRTNYEIVDYALRQGHSVTLLADRVDTDLVDRGAVWEPIQPNLMRRINLFKVREFAVRADRWLARHGSEFDIIHGTGFCLSRRHHINTAHFVHNAWMHNLMHPAKTGNGPGSMYQKLYSSMNSRWEREAFSRAKNLTAVSHRVAGELRQYDLVGKNQPLTVIPAGVDIGEFTPGEPPSRASLGLPDGVPLALFAGDIRTPRKNLDTVLKGLVEAPGIHLGVIGSAERSPYPEMAQALGLSDRVHFLGFRKDIAKVMRAADVFVFPSRYEPFGMVVAEAMACGVPVITCEATGASEYVSPGAGIILKDSEDYSGLARALRDITSDEAKRREMGRAAHKEAQILGWENIARSYCDLYTKCANGSAA